MSVPGAQHRILEAAGQWAGVEVKPHRYGGLEFRFGRRELGHIHGDALLDIPFPKRVRDNIVAAGEAEPHHILPDSGWVSVFLRSEEDVPRAIGLLKRSFLLAAERQLRRSYCKCDATSGSTGHLMERSAAPGEISIDQRRNVDEPQKR